MYQSFTYCYDVIREKKRGRTIFDLSKSVHSSEYDNIPRPMDTNTKEPIEPAHRFEVNIEPDDITDEKSSRLLHSG